MISKLYSARNILSTGFHYGATGAVAAASFMLGAPWAVAAATIVVGGVTTAMIKAQKDFLENQLAKHPDNHKYSPRLGKISQELYERSGLSEGDYPLYDFRAESDNPDNKNSAVRKLFKKTFDLMGQTHNAAALNMGKPVIMISEPLLKLLDDEEEKAVLAHEFAHAAAYHQHLGIPQKLLAGIATMTNGLTALTAALATGVAGVASAVAASIGTMVLFRKLHPRGEILMRDDSKLNLHDRAEKKQITKTLALTSKVGTTAVFTAFSPAYLGIFAAAKGLSLTGGVLSKTFSRSMEYQADRGAVELGASPLALIVSLRKMTIIQERSRQKAFEGDVPKPGELTRAWNRLNSTHPTLERRIDRLSEIAREKGFSDTEIEKAAKAPLTVPEIHDLPHHVIEHLVRAL